MTSPVPTTQPRTRYRLRLLTPRRLHAPSRPSTWLLLFLVSFAGTAAGSYALMEAVDLRFCQPFRCEHMHKVLYFQQRVRQPTVVYLGTSQFLYGVIPAIVEEEAAKHGLSLTTTYNLGVPGAELELSWILARDTLVGDRRPEVMVLGAWPGILSASDRGQPDYVCRYGNLADIAGRVQDGDVALPALAAASFRGLENLIQYPLYSLRKPLVPYRWSRLEQSHGGWWLPSDVAAARPVPPAGWQRMVAKLSKPTTLEFDDNSRPARLLRQFRDLAAERGMRFLLVYPPQHPEYFDHAFTKGSEKRYHDWINSFCKKEGIDYLDLSTPDLTDHGEFMDPVHMNARGAGRFSRQLGEALARGL